MRSAQSKHSRDQEKSSEKKKEPVLPRRCAVIRRSVPEEGWVKMELQFVVYKKPSESQDDDFFGELSELLNQEADDLTKEEPATATSTKMEQPTMTLTKTPSKTTGSTAGTSKAASGESKASTAASTPSYFGKKAIPSLSEASELAMKSHHHHGKCKEADSIKKALPLIEELVRNFRSQEIQTGRPDFKAIRQTAELLLEDAHKSLNKGGKVAHGLLDRVRELNNRAIEARCALSPVPSSSMNLSVSNVNAKSESDGI